MSNRLRGWRFELSPGTKKKIKENKKNETLIPGPNFKFQYLVNWACTLGLDGLAAHAPKYCRQTLLNIKSQIYSFI